MGEAFQDIVVGAILAVVFLCGMQIVLEKPVAEEVRPHRLLETR